MFAIYQWKFPSLKKDQYWKKAVKTHHTYTFKTWKDYYTNAWGFSFAHMRQFFVLKLTCSQRCASSVHKTSESQSTTFFYFTKTQLVVLPEKCQNLLTLISAHAEFLYAYLFKMILRDCHIFPQKHISFVKLHMHCVHPVWTMSIEYLHCVISRLRLQRTFGGLSFYWRS